MQETLLRAWQGLSGFEGRAPLRHWLYRITTTTCLKMIRDRRREPATTADVAWLQPYPDALLSQVADTGADPARIAEGRESVALAFIAALQLLPASQRAVLILRDVLAWPARDVAGLLDTSVAAVNSALQRARATLAAANPAAAASRPLSRGEQLVLDAFVRAWQACDIPALAALLRDDATLTMPPQAIQITGRQAVADFFATVPAGRPARPHPAGRHPRERPPVTRRLPARRQHRRLPRLRPHGPYRRRRPDRHHHRLPRPRPVPHLRPAPYPSLTTGGPPIIAGPAGLSPVAVCRSARAPRAASVPLSLAASCRPSPTCSASASRDRGNRAPTGCLRLQRRPCGPASADGDVARRYRASASFRRHACAWKVFTAGCAVNASLGAGEAGRQACWKMRPGARSRRSWRGRPARR